MDPDAMSLTHQIGNWGLTFGTNLFHGINIKDSEFCKPLYDLNNLASKLGVLIIISAHLTKEDRSEVNMNDILGAGTQGGAVSDV